MTRGTLPVLGQPPISCMGYGPGYLLAPIHLTARRYCCPIAGVPLSRSVLFREESLFRRRVEG